MKTFVYGTLKVGGHYAKKFDSVRKHSESAVLDGYDLYNLGWYPGIVKGKGKVVGEVHEYGEPDKAMALMDVIEGYIESVDDGLYLRRVAKVKTESGELQDAYVYIFNGKLPERATKIESGEWKGDN